MMLTWDEHSDLGAWFLLSTGERGGVVSCTIVTQGLQGDITTKLNFRPVRVALYIGVPFEVPKIVRHLIKGTRKGTLL